MPITPSLLDYTDKDFTSLKARLEKLAKSAFPNWTDFSIAAFGNYNIELYAHVGDVLGFYLDAQAGETRWSTAQLRKNVLALVKLIGYKPKTATASKVDVKITLAAVPAADVNFVAGTVFKTPASPQVRFELTDDAVIPAGTNPPEITVTAANWTSQFEAFAATGLPNQAVILGYTPFLEEGLYVSDAQGVFTAVDSFLDSKSIDRHFTLTVGSGQRAVLRFGNGTSGALPVGTINVFYKTGGGAAGIVEPETVTLIEGSFSDNLNNPVTVTVTNPEKSTVATDAETTAQIKENAPRAIRALNRTVAREDFEINAEQVPGVARALMMTSNEDIAIPENSGRLYVIPVGGGIPTQDLKDAVLEMVTVTKPCTLTFNVGVYDPVYLTVAITAKVFLKSGVSAATAKTAIQTGLTNWFALNNADGSRNTRVDFGFNYKKQDGDPANEIALTTLMDIVASAPGVRKIGDISSDFLVNGKHSDLDLPANTFPRLGTVTLINGDTGNPL